MTGYCIAEYYGTLLFALLSHRVVKNFAISTAQHIALSNSPKTDTGKPHTVSMTWKFSLNYQLQRQHCGKATCSMGTKTRRFCLGEERLCAKKCRVSSTIYFKQNNQGMNMEHDIEIVKKRSHILDDDVNIAQEVQFEVHLTQWLSYEWCPAYSTTHFILVLIYDSDMEDTLSILPCIRAQFWSTNLESTHTVLRCKIHWDSESDRLMSLITLHKCAPGDVKQSGLLSQTVQLIYDLRREGSLAQLSMLASTGRWCWLVTSGQRQHGRGQTTSCDDQSALAEGRRTKWRQPARCLK